MDALRGTGKPQSEQEKGQTKNRGGGEIEQGPGEAKAEREGTDESMQD